MAAEKRKPVRLSAGEREIIASMFMKTLTPAFITIILSSGVLYAGLLFLMRKTGFNNYGINPAGSTQNVSQFIAAYSFIAIINVLLILSLSIAILYITLRHLVMPLLRITREVRERSSASPFQGIVIRKTDKLLVPLVDLINALMKQARRD
ncbi:MAG: hypothetical protein A2219_07760 [Elusimicrobia bacterium RIFOXYA2_FULL_50_26]|nr:MAG: hypothetical protein A2219_07760 [Elusimicrobia bacterium RIFOXYA2_FULL_50_26]OGS23541.1 MAG: hypothetical protein A2314_03285 [Elusimicrobia bacterium RIFOXYB2_FULL_50_12]